MKYETNYTTSHDVMMTKSMCQGFEEEELLDNRSSAL